MVWMKITQPHPIIFAPPCNRPPVIAIGRAADRQHRSSVNIAIGKDLIRGLATSLLGSDPARHKTYHGIGPAQRLETAQTEAPALVFAGQGSDADLPRKSG